jgi:hypothetical protein
MGTSSVHGGFDTHSLPPTNTPHTNRRAYRLPVSPGNPGVDTMTIKDLGRWESISMVERYTRSVIFEDSLEF